MAQSALLTAIGIILPVVFHLLGLGRHFLPMHIPVIIGGMLLGWNYGLIVGLMTPLLSALFTGMPPLMPPLAAAMMVELSLLGALSGAFYGLTRGNVVLSLLAAIIAARAAWGIMGYFLLPLLGIKGVNLLYPLGAGLLSSLPGLIIQAIFIPVIMTALIRLRKGEKECGAQDFLQ
jgi:hypothetical protein